MHVVKNTFFKGAAALLQLKKESAIPCPQFLEDQMVLGDGEQMVAVGWGSNTIALGDPIFSDLRMEINRYLSPQTCNQSLLWDGSIGGEHLCGMNNRRSASCIVDTGSPLILPHMGPDFIQTGSKRTETLDYLVAVNVDGKGCGTPGKPDIYLDVRPLKPWVDGIIGGNKGVEDSDLPVPMDAKTSFALIHVLSHLFLEMQKAQKILPQADSHLGYIKVATWMDEF